MAPIETALVQPSTTQVYFNSAGYLDMYATCFILFLTLSNPIFLPPAYSPALIYFGRERGWWITCNYPTTLKEKNRNRKRETCAICWPKSVLHEEKHRQQENHVRRGPT
jgi:hypothetical protein